MIRPFIVIYAVVSSKRETKECYSRRDGNKSTYSPIEGLEISLICDRSKTSTSTETVLRNSDSDQHLLEALTIINTKQSNADFSSPKDTIALIHDMVVA